MSKRGVLCLFIISTIVLQAATQQIATAVQLVRPDSLHFQLEVVPEALQTLQNINTEVAVLGVVGPYHSGKSYLLNQLLQKQNAFDIGSSVDPKTRGIWMWTEPILYGGKTIILLDTEGFFGSNVSEVYDAKIFSVTALLSSYMIYNTVRTVDQATIDYIELLARRTQLFKLKSSDTKASSNSAPIKFDFPFFQWVIQDFVHNMTAEQATKWLLNSMKSKHTDAENYEEGLLAIFEEDNLECTTLVYPQTDSEKLKDLSRITDEELLLEYREQMAQLRKRQILDRIDIKRESQKSLSGPAFVVLLQTLVEAANSDKFPSMPSVWNSFIESSRKDAREFGVLKYKENLAELLQENGLANQDEFEVLHRTAVKSAQDLMVKQLYGLVDSIDDDWKDVQVKIRLEYEYHKLINQNDIERHLIAQKSTIVQLNKDHAQAIKLPKSSSDIKKIELATVTRAQDEFKKSTKKFSAASRYQNLIDELEHEIRGQFAQVSMENSNLIQLFLKDNVETIEQQFRDEQAARTSDRAVVPQQLDAELSAKKSKFLNEFKSKTDIYHDETVYKLFENNIETHLDNHIKSIRDKNAELIEKSISELHSRLEARAMKQMSEIEAFDVDDLARDLEQVRDTAINEYKNTMKDFSATNSYKLHLYELNDILNGKKDQLIKHRVAELQDKYEAHLRKAHAEIESNFVCGDWQTTRGQAIKILLRQLADLGVSKSSGQKLSEKYVDKVIKDLFDNKCPTSGSWLWVVIGAVIFVGLGFVFRRK